MKLTTILESKQQLVEQHRRKGLITLVESCQGLDKDQTRIVEGIYKELRPLIEASMSPEQIKQLFGEVEKGVAAGGGNRTMLGKGADVAAKANEIINKAGKWLQDTTPVQAFDQKFDDLKNKINTTFPDSKLLDGISKLGMLAKENPGKTAAIIGVLTAIASIAGGPLGGAIAGQVLKGTVELLKGEKLSTAVGKGLKAAALGWLTGKAIDFIGDALAKPVQMVADKLNPNIIKSTYSNSISEIGGEFGDRFGTFTTGELAGRAEDVRDIGAVYKDAVQAWKAGDYAQADTVFRQVQTMTEKLADPEYLAQIGAEASQAQSWAAAAKGTADFFGRMSEVAQGAVTGATGAKDEKAAAPAAAPAKESISRKGRKLSEGQVYMLFNRMEIAQVYLAEAGFLSKVGDKIKGAAGAVGKKLATVGSNLTNKVTADKLNSAWQKAGSPTDSDDVYNVLTQAGVDPAVIAPVFDTMKLPVPKAAAQAWDKPEGDQPAQGTAQGGAAPAATPAGQPVSNLATGDQPAQGAAQGGAAPAQGGATPAAPASGPVDVVALAAEIKAIEPNIVADVKTMLDTDPSAKKKAAPKAAPVAPAATPAA